MRPRPSAIKKWPLLPMLLLLLLRPAVGVTVSSAGAARQFVMPDFESLPPRLTYTRPGVPVSLACRAHASVVQCGLRSDAVDQIGIRFVPADTDLTPGVRCHRDGIRVESEAAVGAILSRLEFFCKAVSTSNFAVISAPFRIEVAVLESYTGPRELITKQCYKGNKVQIECQPPVSTPPAEIVFTADGAPLNPLGRFRSVQLADGVFALVIMKVLSDDGDKVYGCNATNPITRQTVESPVRTLLKVQQPLLEPNGAPFQDAVSPFPPKVVSPPKPTELTVTEGDNVTYTCITESSPIAEVSYLRDEGRQALPPTAAESRDFGILHFSGIRKEDQGAYMCRVSYRRDLTASSHIRDEKKLARFNIAVTKRLSIASRPEDVILDEPDASASFNCSLEGGGSARVGRSLLWFVNGRLIDSKDPTSGFVIEELGSGASRLIVPRFDSSQRGVVQCVANDRERRVWVSAQAVLLMRGESVQTQPLPETPTEAPTTTAVATTRLPITEVNTSVSYRMLKYTDSFVQITCGSRYSSPQLYYWRFFKDDQPVDLQSEEYPPPYMQFSDVLSLVMASQRSRARFYQGVYVCRTYDRATGRLVWSEVTHLSFEPSPTEKMLEATSPGPPAAVDSGPTEAPPSVDGEGASGKTSGSGPGREVIDVGEPIVVSAPEVTLAEGPLALNISWTVSPPGAAFRIRRFRIQQHELAPQSERFRRLADSSATAAASTYTTPAEAGRPTTLEEVSASVQSVLWSGVKPRRVYQFRVAFDIIGSAAASGDGTSPWSRPVSFAHVVGPAPRITGVPRNSREPLTWTYIGDAGATGFVVWVRNLSVPQPHRRYIKYWVANGSARQFFFYDLAAGPSYELCMFARLAGVQRSPDSRSESFNLAGDVDGGDGSRQSDRRGDRRQMDGVGDKEDTSLPSPPLLILLVVAGAIGLLLLAVGFVFLGLCLRRLRHDRKLRARLTNDSWSNNITYAPHMPMPTAYAVDPMKEPPKLQLQPHQQPQLYLTYQPTTVGGRGHQQPQLNLCDMLLDGGIGARPPLSSAGQHSIYASLRSQRERTPMLLEFCPAPAGASQCSPAALQGNGSCHGNEEDELNTATTAAATPRLQQRCAGLNGQADTESLYSGFASQQQQQQQQQELSQQPSDYQQQQHYQTPTTGRSSATLDSSRRHHKRRRRQQGQGMPTLARDQPMQPMTPMLQNQQNSPTPPPVPKHRRTNGQIYARPSDLHVFGSVGPTPTTVSHSQSQRHRYTMGNGGGYSLQQRGQAEGSAPPVYPAMGLPYNA